MAIAMQSDGRYVEAVENYKRALRIEPNNAETYNSLGIALRALERLDEAVESYRKAVDLEPDFCGAYNNLGIALNAQGHWPEAMASYRRALDLEPGLAEVYYNFANCLRDQCRLPEAIENYRKAIELRPGYADAKWNLSHALLVTGRFEEGWKESDWWRCDGDAVVYPHIADKPWWDGSGLTGRRLLVHFERGLGDNIHFLRYLPMAKARRGTVIFEANKTLYNLLKGFEGIDELVEVSADRESVVEFDFQTSLLGLPRIFGTTLETIPANVPYLKADTAMARYWADRFSHEYFNIGVVWSGDPRHGNDRNRSCGLEYFISLANVPGVKLYGLQKGAAAFEVEQLVGEMEITNFGEYLGDLADTAAVIENLDLVISVDTAALHLAGAMGKPVWGLLPFVPDWRWMLEREDSPWYPTMRLFRQKSPGDWLEVFIRVEAQLRKLLSERGSNDAANLHAEGVKAYQSGEYEKAFELVGKAISCNPEVARFHNTLGVIQEARGRYADAVDAYECAVSLRADYAEAYHNMAIAMQCEGRYVEAIERCRRAISLKADYAQAYNTLGFCFEKDGHIDEAIDSYRRAIRLRGDYAEAYNHLGVLLNDRGQCVEAVENYIKALQIEPDYAEVYSNLGVALKTLERWDEAIGNYRRAIELEPDFAEAYYNLANVLRDQGKCSEAIDNYRYAIQLSPDYAEAHWNMALALLLNGQFIEGWQQYKWRRNAELKLITDLHTYGKPRWDGSSFEGKRLFVHYEQGLGDNIQFARYLAMVKKLGGTVIFETLGPLMGLF
jgi:tetratricopeptide (TPR) repeat protein